MAIAELQISVFGGLNVQADSAFLRLSPINARLLLRLVFADGRPISLEQLYRDVWRAGSGHPVDRENRVSVQKRIGELRKILDPALPGELSQVIRNDYGTTFSYRLELRRDQVDMWTFRDLAAAADRADPATAAVLCRQGLELWCDWPSSSTGDERDFVAEFRLLCVRTLVGLQRRLISAYIDMGALDEARSAGLDLLNRQPDGETRILVDRIRELSAPLQRVVSTYALENPNLTVEVAVGDLFAAPDADLVVGFTDTFDTSTRRNRIISSNSMQGQLLERVYGGDHGRLDRELRRALMQASPVSVESAADKPHGKRVRYPIGTVAVLPNGDRRIFCVAYSRMSNDLVARSSVENLEWSLANLWTAVHRYGQFGRLVIPLVGSGLSRVNAIGYQEFVELIARSFIVTSKDLPVCRELRIVLTPAQSAKIDVSAVNAFLARHSR